MPVFLDLKKEEFYRELDSRIHQAQQLSPKKLSLHICVYEYSHLISQVFFELLFTGVLNYRSQILCPIPENILVFIEIANTFADTLLIKLNNILEKLPRSIKIEKIQDVMDYDCQNLNLKQTYFYLFGLQNPGDDYFVSN